MQDLVEAKFSIGHIVKHKFLNFRGVIFDIDPVFANTEEWYNAIPKNFRPDKNQPFYHLFAENEEVFYIAYVSEQNLLEDHENGPANHPDIKMIFSHFNGRVTFHIKEQQIKSKHQSVRVALQ